MNCPKCGEVELKILHTDPIECNDCGSTMNISYCLCPNCQYAFRMNNDQFLDNMDLTKGVVEEVVEELEEMLVDDDHIGSMLDLVHPCVRCGETMTAYNPDTFEYECLSCGFKWEVLNHE